MSAGPKKMMESPITDHPALPAQIGHRSKAQVNIQRQQLGRHKPTGLADQGAGRLGIGVPKRTHAGGRRQSCHALLQAPHTSAFLVDRDQQPRLAQGVAFLAQGRHGICLGAIAGEQDHAAYGGMLQDFAVFRAQFRAGDIYDQRTQHAFLTHRS